MANRARKPNYELTGKQRSYLRALAHHLDPLVQVGKEGRSDGLFAAIRDALDQHELIKVKVLESSPDDRKTLAEPLALATGCHVVGQVGRILILYRMHDEKPVIELPRRR